MEAYKALVAAKQWPSDTAVAAKTVELFPHLKQSLETLRHRAIRVRKYDPNLSVEESVWLESCHMRPDCVEAAALNVFRKRFPQSEHSDSVILDALERLGPRRDRTRLKNREYKLDRREAALELRRKVLATLKSFKDNANQSHSPLDLVAREYPHINPGYLETLISEVRKYMLTSLRVEEAYFLRQLWRRQKATPREAKTLFDQHFPLHGHSEKEIIEAYLIMSGFRLPDDPEASDMMEEIEEEISMEKDKARYASKSSTRAADVRRKVFGIYKDLTLDNPVTVNPRYVLIVINRTYPGLGSTKSLYGIIAEVRKYPPDFSFDESVQMTRWARRKLNIDQVLRRFRRMFPTSTASDEVVVNAFNKLVRD
jgi:hypothetical protein